MKQNADYYSFKAPTALSRRRSFAMMRRTPDRKWVTVYSEDLSNINTQFSSGRIGFAEARKAIREVVDRLNDRQAKDAFNEANRKILKRYWDSEYADRDIIGVESAYFRLRHAVNAVGDLSLATASRQEIQKALEPLRPNVQRNVVGALSQILIFLDRRDMKLRKKREEIQEIKYLNEREFETMVAFLKQPLVRLLHRVCFATGARLGEVFAITEASVFGDYVGIDSQIDRQKRRRHTKTRRSRYAFIIPGREKDVAEWASIPMTERLKIRQPTFSKVTTTACMKAFPNNAEKHITIKDLRHSYAHHLNSAYEISPALISKTLGNSTMVAVKHYVGSTLTPELIQLFRMLVAEKKAKLEESSRTNCRPRMMEAWPLIGPA